MHAIFQRYAPFAEQSSPDEILVKLLQRVVHGYRMNVMVIRFEIKSKEDFFFFSFFLSSFLPMLFVFVIFFEEGEGKRRSSSRLSISSLFEFRGSKVARKGGGWRASE